MSPLTGKALSVRQPWAWAIIHAGKDMENRTAGAMKWICPALPGEGWIYIHASLGMTQDEYADAAGFMADLGVKCPPPGELLRGGLIGTVTVLGMVAESQSPWFFGPRALELAEPEAIDFIGCTGALGVFAPVPNNAAPDAPKRWMQPRPARERFDLGVELPF